MPWLLGSSLSLCLRADVLVEGRSRAHPRGWHPDLPLLSAGPDLFSLLGESSFFCSWHPELQPRSVWAHGAALPLATFFQALSEGVL